MSLSVLRKHLLEPVNVILLGVVLSYLGYFLYTTAWEDIIKKFGEYVVVGVVAYLASTSTDIIAGERKSTTWILIENRMKKPVSFLWGNLGHTEGVDPTMNTLLPNRVAARKLKHENAKYFSGKYPVVIIKQDGSSNYVTVILQEPTELCHTKVFEITEDGIVETSSPKHRNWHVDMMDIYAE